MRAGGQGGEVERRGEGGGEGGSAERRVGKMSSQGKLTGLEGG